jgi:acyl-CoA dehydrogenase
MELAAAAASLADLHDDRAIVAALGRTGLMAAAMPPVELQRLCVAREAIAYHSPHADSILAVCGLGCHPVAVAGGAAGRHWIDPVAAGEQAAGFALTEPDAGSDVNGMTASATPRGAGYVLAGKKTFISNAGFADWFVVFARAPGGPAAFVVERKDGLATLDDVPLSSPHPIGSLVLDGVEIPADRRLGAEGDGVRLALGTLDTFRASVGAAACGMAARALDEAIAHVKKRKQFGKALADFQLTQARLADCATELEAARGLVARAAQKPNKINVAMAKLFATEAAQRIIDSAVQLHGGLGVVRGVPVEALYREVRALRIYEGTSEIQKLIIARELLKG